MHLLDVNVLIALGDPTHTHYHRARAWFLSSSGQAWATWPLTENGFVRVLGQLAYPGFKGVAADARMALQTLVSFPGHQFLPDDLSFCDAKAFPKVSNSRHLTDLYLLGLAVSRQGKLVTLDERIDPSIIPGGPQAYFVLP